MKKSQKKKKKVKTKVIPLDELKEQAMSLASYGKTTKEIAKKLNRAERTIQEWLQEKRADILQEEFKDVDDAIAKLAANQRMRIDKLGDIIDSPIASEKGILKALKLLQEEDQFSVKRSQMAGRLPKEGTEITLKDGRNDEVVDDWTVGYQTMMKELEEKRHNEKITKEEKEN